MDLYSGLPFWIIKNELYDYFHPLKGDHRTDIVVIGSGITGALVAHELCSAGIQCTVVDKRTISTGSTAASTAQLQYEIDIPLSKMVDIVGKDIAVNAYKASLQSIGDIEDVLQSTGVKPGFKKVPSLYLASNKTGLRLLEKEYTIRKENGLPVTYLDSAELKRQHHIDGLGALKNNRSAQMDAYAASTGILKYHMKHSGLQLFSHTLITEFKEVRNGYELLTEHGSKLHCKYVVVAAGFEAGQFLPKQVMQLNSTYALISYPVEPEQIWPEHSLIWETKEPYFYMRTTQDNRMIIGGEDEPFQNPEKRDRLLRSKIKKLEKQFAAIYPDIPFVTDMAWCGTFSSTKDGLPYIGRWKNKDRMFFALGYGGNGITFSMIAAQVIKNTMKGIKDERAAIFGFDRKSRLDDNT